MKKNRLLAVAGSLFMVTGLVSSAGGAAPASAATSSTPIVVGGLYDLGVGDGTAQGFQAGIYRFNKTGGLDGRKIKFVGSLNDNYSPSTSLQNAQQLIENDHVNVIAPFVSSVADASTSQFLAASKVPALGYATSAAYKDTDWAWGINGNQGNVNAQSLTGVNELLAGLGQAKTPGKVKVALIGNNIPQIPPTLSALGAVFKHVGSKVVYSEDPIAVIGTTNYQPYAQAVIGSGANVVFEVLGVPDCVGLAAALKADGYKGAVYNGTTYLPGELASQPSEKAALAGSYISDLFPADENNTPAVKQAIKDLKSVGAPPYLTVATAAGYWSAIMLEQMLRADLKKVGGDPDKVTGATLENMVTTGYTYTDPIAGGLGNIYFPAQLKIPSGCLTLLRTNSDGSFKQLSPYSCSGGVLNVSAGKVYNQKTGR
jgi:ABC-type branched-subunit amino acid transport system substrate-binding protein